MSSESVRSNGTWKNKRPRSSKKAAGDDRISSLPDAILEHILSFLDTRSAAQSSILSTRWRGLWLHAPALDLQIDFDRHPCILSALSHHDPPFLRRLCIETHQSIMPWGLIRNVVDDKLTCSRKTPAAIQELRLRFQHTGHIFYFRGDMSCFENLLILELVACDVGKMGTMRFPKIETLSLKRVTGSEQAIGLVISSCVNVRKLELDECFQVNNLHLSLKELREIVLGRSRLRNVTIDAPKLQFVELAYQVWEFRLCLKSSPALKRAVVGSSGQIGPCDVDQIKHLASVLGAAPVMELRFEIDLITPQTFKNYPTLPHVKKLLMSGLSNVAAVVMLKMFPNLEYLSFDCCDDEERMPEKEEETLQRYSVHCLTNSLKMIELNNFNDLNITVEVAKFLVRNAAVLEKMHISGNYLPRAEIRHCLNENTMSQSVEIIFF